MKSATLKLFCNSDTVHLLARVNGAWHSTGLSTGSALCIGDIVGDEEGGIWRVTDIIREPGQSPCCGAVAV